MPVAEEELANLTTEQQVELANKAADAAVQPDPPVETQTDETPPEGDETPPEETVADPKDAEFLEFVRSRIGDQPWLSNFKTADDLVKALPEMQSLIGRQSQAVAALRNLEAIGLTTEEIARWMAQKTQPQQTTQTQEQRSFAIRGADGKFYPSAKSPANWETILNQELAAATDRLLDPAQMAESLKPFLNPAVEQQLQQTKQEMQAQVQGEADQARFVAMVNQNKDLYYAGNQYTPLGLRVTELLQEYDPTFGHTISNAMPDWKRLEAAHRIAMREMPTAKPRNVPANAKPITQPKVSNGKAIKADDWMKNNTFNGNKDMQFRAFNEAVNKGEVVLE